MSQLVVYMEVNTQNKDCSSLKNNHFKMWYASCSSRCGALNERRWICK